MNIMLASEWCFIGFNTLIKFMNASFKHITNAITIGIFLLTTTLTDNIALFFFLKLSQLVAE